MRILLIVILSFFLVVPLIADEEIQYWAPTASEGEKNLDFDWVRLTNGEWLKGEFITMRDDSLVFDSDEFGEIPETR